MYKGDLAETKSSLGLEHSFMMIFSEYFEYLQHRMSWEKSVYEFNRL